jgi:hypothetical protein
LSNFARQFFFFPFVATLMSIEIAWETTSGTLLGRWAKTLSAVLLSPRDFFKQAAKSQDAKPALTFSVWTGVVYGILLGTLLMLSSGKGIPQLQGNAGWIQSINHKLPALVAFLPLLAPPLFALCLPIASLLVGTICSVLGSFVSGKKLPASSGIRIVGYCAGTLALVPIPLVGMFAFFGLTIALIIGIDELFQCGLGRAITAVLMLPMVLSLVGFLLFFASKMAGC